MSACSQCWWQQYCMAGNVGDALTTAGHRHEILAAEVHASIPFFMTLCKIHQHLKFSLLFKINTEKSFIDFTFYLPSIDCSLYQVILFRCRCIRTWATMAFRWACVPGMAAWTRPWTVPAGTTSTAATTAWWRTVGKGLMRDQMDHCQ